MEKSHIAAALTKLQADIARVERDKPIHGLDGKDGRDAPTAQEVAALVPVAADGKDGKDGKDGPTAQEVAALVPVAADGKDGKDGRDGQTPQIDVQSIAKMAAAHVPVAADGVDGKDGRDAPTAQAVAALVPPAVNGRDGRDGKDGASVTSAELKNNELFLRIDGKKKSAGFLKIPAPTTFTPGGGGGSRAPRPDILGWDANYTPSKTVAALTAVHDDGWLMASNVATSERAAPEPTGPVKDLFNGALTPEQHLAKQVISGIRVTVEESGYVGAYAVDTVAGSEYQIFTVEDPLGRAVVSEVASFTSEETGWHGVNVAPFLLVPGKQFDLVVLTHEPNPTPVEFSGDWDYLKPGGGGGTTQPPQAGQVVHPNNLQAVIRVSKTDNASGDRSAELEALSLGDIITSQGVRWLIQDAVDDGSYMSYAVSPALQAQNTGVTEFVFETVTATQITIGRDAGYWDLVGAANIRGLLAVDTDYANATVSADAFGVNITVQAAKISGDWDLMSSHGVVGLASPTTVENVVLGEYETTATQAPSGEGAAGAITIHYGPGGSTTGSEFTVVADTDPTEPGKIIALAGSGGIEYKFLVGLRIGRAGAAGVAVPMMRFMYSPDGVVANGVQVGGTFSVQISAPDTTWREVFDINFSPVVGSKVWVELARDEAGDNSGQLQAEQPSGTLAAWNPVATARITISKTTLV